MNVPWQLLSHHVQKKVVRGLQTRFQKYSEASGRSAIQSQLDIEQLAAEFDHHIHQVKSEQSHKEAKVLTEWDTDIDSAWRVMETGSLGSLQRQEKKLAQLLAEMREKREAEVKSHASTKAKYTKEYEVVRRHPGKRLEQRTNELQHLVAKNREQLSLTEQLLISRQVKIKTSEPESAPPEWSNLKEAYQFLQDQQKGLAECDQRMRRHPAAVWSGAGRVFLMSAIVAVAAGAGMWPMMPPLYAVVGAVIAGMIFMGIWWLALRAPMAAAFRREFPKAQAIFHTIEKGAIQARKMLESECQSELQRIKSEFEAKISEADQSHKAKLDEMQAYLDAETKKIRTTERNVRQQMATLHVESLQSVQHRHQPKFDGMLTEHDSTRTTLETTHRRKIQDLRRSFTEGLQYLAKRVQVAGESTEKIRSTVEENLQTVFPNWSDSQPWQRSRLERLNEAAVLPIGRLHIAVHQPESNESLSDSRLASIETTLPLTYRLIEDGCLVLESSDSHGRKMAQSTIQNLLMRALTSLPAAGFQVTVIDPDGLGKDFSWLMHLADADPKIVNYRVWTQANHIAEQLGRLSHHTEDVIQQLLRDKYADIRAYNREAGSMAEPYRLVVWSRFPSALDENAWRMLCSLMASGGRCGVGVILHWDSSLPWPSLADVQRLKESGLWVRYPKEGTSESPRVVGSVLEDFSIQLAEPPSDELQSKLLEKCAREALEGGRVEVPFETIMPKSEPIGVMSSADGLTIPLGQAGVGRSQYLRLGQGTAQHVLIAGKTGSGKSSLLHTMVTSAAIQYGPDQLRLVLLDFKKGVEFQVYSETMIPHCDIIGIESQREFGLSTLEYLDRVMQRRGEMFREAGVQNVASWVERHPNIPMPRILTVIDEFQELFVEDDKLAQQASMLLDRVVRQGRSFGMHVVLASQTLGGAYSLPRTTLAQMAVRIALQCEGSDAMIILSEDNLAAERLRHAGQAVYNDASGRVEGNQPFQVAYLSKKEQEQRLAAIGTSKPFVDESNNMLGKCVVFEGHKPAIWEPNTIAQVLRDAASLDQRATYSVVGDSVSIEPAVTITWARQAGRNLLLVGPEDRNAADCLVAILASAAYQSQKVLKQSIEIALLDGTRPDDRHTARLPELVRGIDSQAHIGDIRTSEQIVAWVHDQFQSRQSDPDAKHSPLYFVISQLGRFRDLRKSEDFSFGSDDGPAKPDKQLEELLRDGPSLGIHTIIWADNYNTVSRSVSRQSMHDLELKILMQMSSNDSNHLIDSPLANRLDSHVLLLHDEATGVGRKFRPYRLDDLAALADWSRP